MARIRINKKQTKEDRSFKLGYQKGFREAEEATMSRLQTEYYDPLRRDLQTQRDNNFRLEADNIILRAREATLLEEKQNLSKELVRLQREHVKGFATDHPTTCRDTLGYNTTVHSIGVVSSELASIEERIMAELASGSIPQALEVPDSVSTVMANVANTNMSELLEESNAVPVDTPSRHYMKKILFGRR